MGWFGNLIGSADSTVIQNGILGRGEITDLQMSGMTLQTGNGLVERKCTITANVYLDNTPMFVATITQRVQEIVRSRSCPPAAPSWRCGSIPTDHTRVAIDFNSAVPEVTLAPSADPITPTAPPTCSSQRHSPSRWCSSRTSRSARRTRTAWSCMRCSSPPTRACETPYQLTVGNPVPATALPLLFPGSKLHAKLGDDPNSVVVDWAAGAAT